MRTKKQLRKLMRDLFRAKCPAGSEKRRAFDSKTKDEQTALLDKWLEANRDLINKHFPGSIKE